MGSTFPRSVQVQERRGGGGEKRRSRGEPCDTYGLIDEGTGGKEQAQLKERTPFALSSVKCVILATKGWNPIRYEQSRFQWDLLHFFPFLTEWSVCRQLTEKKKTTRSLLRVCQCAGVRHVCVCVCSRGALRVDCGHRV